MLYDAKKNKLITELMNGMIQVLKRLGFITKPKKSTPVQNQELKTLDSLPATTTDGFSMTNLDLLPINKFSRPGKDRLSTEYIVVHFSEGPGQTARQVRNYLRDRDSFGGYSFIVDDKEIIQLSLINEMTPHVGGKMIDSIEKKLGPQRVHEGYSIQNWKTLGVCFCHPDNTGKPTWETFNRLLNLVTSLCIQFNFDSSKVIRHFDVTEKVCPGYYVRNPSEWHRFLTEVDMMLKLK